MSEANKPIDAKALLLEVKALQDKLQKSVERGKQEGIIDKDFEDEQAKNAQFLIDKFVPILTAILGGIAYVLLEHKAHSGWPMNCFRMSGAFLTVALLIIFARTWIEPLIQYQFKRSFVAFRYDGKLGPRTWLEKHIDLIEGTRLLLVLTLVLGGLSLAAVGTGLESGYAAPVTSTK